MDGLTETAERFHQEVDLVEAVPLFVRSLEAEVEAHDPAAVREHERDIGPRLEQAAILLEIG